MRRARLPSPSAALVALAHGQPDRHRGFFCWRRSICRQPKTALEGKFSIEYALAALLLDGDLTMASFTDAAVTRQEAQQLLSKVTRSTIPDEKNYTGPTGYNIVSVETRRGRFETREDRTPGSPAWPLTDVERATKFVDCASVILNVADATALYDLTRRCRQLDDIGSSAKAAIHMRSSV